MAAEIALTESAAPREPIDRVEELVSAHRWAYERRGDTELAVQIAGQWCDLQMWFAWRPDAHALFFTCALDMRVPRGRRADIYALLAGINERLWVGHFELWSTEGWPTFRHTLVGDRGASVVPGVLREVVEAARTECDRYYPAFQFVLWGGENVENAIAAATMETEGSA